ncbi:SRPBCC family protein [uncultured Dokdonia sp.]|uniref:SRPBCC family protein n=1 Tax=uncultured Dokdonia sp. TaxID=575653 RepID=UPI0026336827|nr:SRPBCC family protein [uncultured Dokdonia sp.]
MKYLKYLLILILILGIVFIAKGLLTPSISYENEITVNASAKESWSVMNNETNLPKWIKGFKKIEPVSGTPNTVGAVSKVYIEEQGEEMTMEETITAVKENELMAMTFTMDFMNMDYEMSFKEKDGQTVISSKSTTTGNGIMAKSMVSFMKGAMSEQEDKNLMNLKNLIEGNSSE